MILSTLRTLFLQHIRSLYSGERQLCKAMPKILEGVTSHEVKSMLKDCQAESEARYERLEALTKVVHESFGGERNRVMEAFLKEAIELSELRGEERVLDLALMTVIRQIGHFEKSSYEIARSFADVLEETEVSKMIDQMLSETEQTERALILLTEDMMDSLHHEVSGRGPVVDGESAQLVS